MSDPDAAVHVLIAEDSATQAALLRALLEEEGFRVGRAKDGREAAELFDREEFHIVLSDIVMPGMDGFELCRHVKRAAGGRRVPCILMTAMQDPMDVARGLESGADNFITKPYDPADLIGKVRGALAPPAAARPGGPAAADDRAQMIGLLVSAFEEAARKGAELELRNRELGEVKAQLERSTVRLLLEHEKVLEAVGDGIVALDAAGILTLANPSAALALGWAREELVGRDAHQAFFHSLPDGAPFPPGGSPVAAVLSGHQAYDRAEALFWRKDGSTFPVEHTCTPMRDDRGVIVGAVLAFRDISERQRVAEEHVKLEEQLRQSQKMDAVGRLAGGVAHDFNNLLTVIIGFTELLLDEPLEVNVDRKRVRQIRQAAEHAAHLTRQLLAFSRKQVVRMSAIAVGDVALGLEPMISRLVGENIKVKLDLEPSAGWIMGDTGQIGQVIMNLAVNARDAMPEGGKMVISVGNADPRDDAGAPPSASPGRHVRLSVKDSGTGMTDVTKGKLFEPFFTTKPAGSGTGLGLSTVFGIVQQNGGIISVQSAPGRGTTFNVYFPRIERPEPVQAPGTGLNGGPPRRSATVLLVEDQDEIRNLVSEVLERDGHRVHAAANAEEAIALAARPKVGVDMLVTDMVMPGMSGAELVAVLRESIPNLRVLLMSGYTQQQPSVADGMAFIQKPFSPKALTEKVQETLRAAVV